MDNVYTLSSLKRSHTKIYKNSLNSRRYTDNTVLMADTERKFKEPLDKVVKESLKKRLTINCKKTKFMVASKYKDLAMWEVF